MPNFLIITCGTSMRAEYVTSLINTMNELAAMNLTCRFGNAQSALIAHARQTAFDTAQNVEFDKMVFIDSDISWTPDNFIKLVNHDVDIVSGVYFDELGNVVATNKRQKRISIEDCNQQKLLPLRWCGFGFVAITKKIVQELKQPFLRNGEYGEDVSFCLNASDAGYKIWLDPQIRVTHHKVVGLNF